MAGRSRDSGAEVRDQRMTVRWTKSEKGLLKKAQEEQGIEHLVDLPRVMTLRQLALEDAIGDKAELLEKARKGLGLSTREETIWALASVRLDQIRSLLEDHVAE